MTDNTDKLLQRVHTIMPDLKIEHFEKNNEGAINDVLIVNHELVFRFAKTEEYARRQYGEMMILDLVRPHVGLSVPTPIHRNFDCTVYPLLKGAPLSRNLVMSFDEGVQNQIAGQIGTFLFKLHTLDISNAGRDMPMTRAPVKRENWLKLQERIKEKIYPLLQNYQIEWADGLLSTALDNPEFFHYETALIHGDLASYHFLFDVQTREITGVIDFGMAGIGDPASDIGNLISIYGESFVKRMKPHYPNLESLLARARFYAESIELEWTLLGLESGQNFWFTAHLAGARDIHS